MYAHAIVAQEIIHYFFLIISLAFTNTQSYGSHWLRQKEIDKQYLSECLEMCQPKWMKERQWNSGLGHALEIK